MTKSGHWNTRSFSKDLSRKLTAQDGYQARHGPLSGSEVMTKSRLDRRVLLTPGQKAEAAELRTMGFTRSQAWRRVLTPEQRQVFYDQIRTAERLRYIKNPHREIMKRARRIRKSACKRGAKY